MYDNFINNQGGNFLYFKNTYSPKIKYKAFKKISYTCQLWVRRAERSCVDLHNFIKYFQLS